MKAVILSIQPKWCELIASGRKTIEVRKSVPKLDTPFKCYIYCTKGTFDITLCPDLNAKSVKKVSAGRGNVIGEFVCDNLDEWNTSWLCWNDFLKGTTCIDNAEIMDYMNNTLNRKFYLWHISRVKIYDNPKELGEFCKGEVQYGKTIYRYDSPLTRPPQSWCYVEETE